MNAFQLLNGATFGALLFVVASGFTLIFGLLRIVNLAHGALYLAGGYVGFSTALHSGSFVLGGVAAVASVGVLGLALDQGLLRFVRGHELREVLLTLGVAFVLNDLALVIWGGDSPDPGCSPRRRARVRRVLPEVSPVRARRRRPDLHRLVVAAAPDANRRADPRRRRRPGDGGGVGDQYPPGVSGHIRSWLGARRARRRHGRRLSLALSIGGRRDPGVQPGGGDHRRARQPRRRGDRKPVGRPAQHVRPGDVSRARLFRDLRADGLPPGVPAVRPDGTAGVKAFGPSAALPLGAGATTRSRTVAIVALVL